MLSRIANAMSSPGKERVVPQSVEDDSTYDDEDDDFDVYENETAFEETVRSIKEFFAYQNLKRHTKKLLEEYKITITISHEDLSMTMTIFVLFASNIKDLSATKDVDAGFFTATAICLFYFIAEFIGATWSKSTVKSFYPKFLWEGYLFSFFWWLDLVAIFSLFFDVPFIAGPLGISAVLAANNSTSAQKGARVVRLVRLVRLIKLQKIASEKRNRLKRERDLTELVRRGIVDYEEEKAKMDLNEYRQSKLGAQLTDAITKKVIILVLVMVILLPFVNYSPANYYNEFAVTYLHSVNKNLTMNSTMKEAALQGFLAMVAHDPEDNPATNSYPFLLYLEMSPSYNETIVYKPYQLDYIREANQEPMAYTDYVDGVKVHTKAIFSDMYTFRQTAQLEILMTLFIGFLLVAGSVILTDDAQRILLTPIERMMNMVDAVARNPLTKLEFDNDGKAAYETRLLESTIEKITGLLRIGFGEAGAGIISANLQSASGTSVDPLLPGVRVYCIVGFCDIHRYEYVSNVLSNDILIFTNTIAEIVHTSVQYWGGQCNKNLGNAFVIIWRIGDEETIAAMTSSSTLMRGQSDGRLLNSSSSRNLGSPSPSKSDLSSSKKKGAIDLKRVPGVDVMADKALIGYLKIIAEINRSKGVLAYRAEPRLTQSGAQEFKVRMGFGLHAGWAIEGAVGSKQKVDATYLSPHVNMAARLETSSRQYGVPLLASHFFTELMTPECFRFLRKVDIVTVKGSEVPIEIFTYDSLQEQTFTERISSRKPSVSDLDMDEVGSEVDSPDSPSPSSALPSPSNSPTNLGRKGKSFKVGLAIKSPFCLNTDETDDIFERDSDLLLLRAHVTQEFLAIFKAGIDTYLEGAWDSAREHLEKADRMMAELLPAQGGDGPCQTLLEYMGERQWRAPEDWRGFRPLTSK